MTTETPPDEPPQTILSIQIPESHRNHDRYVEMFLRDEVFQMEIVTFRDDEPDRTDLAADGMFTDYRVDDGMARFTISEVGEARRHRDQESVE